MKRAKILYRSAVTALGAAALAALMVVPASAQTRVIDIDPGESVTIVTSDDDFGFGSGFNFNN